MRALGGMTCCRALRSLPRAADDLFAAPPPRPASQAQAASAVDSWDIFNTPSAQQSQVTLGGLWGALHAASSHSVPCRTGSWQGL